MCSAGPSTILKRPFSSCIKLINRFKKPNTVHALTHRRWINKSFLNFGKIWHYWPSQMILFLPDENNHVCVAVQLNNWCHQNHSTCLPIFFQVNILWIFWSLQPLQTLQEHRTPGKHCFVDVIAPNHSNWLFQVHNAPLKWPIYSNVSDPSRLLTASISPMRIPSPELWNLLEAQTATTSRL